MVIVNYIDQHNEPIGFTGKVFSYFDNKNVEVNFIKNNVVHRYYGPAFIWYDGSKEWWFNGKNYGDSHKGDYEVFYSQKQFIKDINKQWLL